MPLNKYFKSLVVIRCRGRRQYVGFAVVGVNLDADRNRAVQFLRQKRLPWIQLHESGGLSSRYASEMGVLSLPVTLLIDSRGRVVNRGIPVSQVEEEAKKLLR